MSHFEAGVPGGKPGQGAMGKGWGVLGCRALGLGGAVCQGPREPTGFSWLIEGRNIKIPMFGIFLKDTVPDVE